MVILGMPHFIIDTSIPLKQALKQVFKSGGLEVTIANDLRTPWWSVRRQHYSPASIVHYYGPIPTTNRAEISSMKILRPGKRDVTWSHSEAK